MSQVSKNPSTGDSHLAQDRQEPSLEKLINSLNAAEIGIVHWAVKRCYQPHIRNTLIFINHLGNGWIYLAIAISLLAIQGQASWPLLIAASIAALVSHCIYPLIKNAMARLRPCDYDPSLDLCVGVLDKYSCPSGHVMTATAVGIPLLIMLPHLMPVIVGGYLLIAWARISLGHHYPSDLLFGAFLGGSISAPVSLLVIS